MPVRPRNRRALTVVLLVACAAPLGARAHEFVCWPIVPGDTAASLALRLTGNADAAYSDVFQIRDPARRTFVPKSQYRRLRTDWQACVARAAAKTSLPPLPPSPAPLEAPAAGIWSSGRIAAAALFVLLAGVALAVQAAPRPMPPAARRVGEAFISEFARPLIDPSSGSPPIATRLRFVRRVQQLEIAIAPGEGRRYPNLNDHKKNVEYDVGRVLERLGSGFAVSRLRAAGKWVVVRIRLADLRQAGAP